MKLKGTKMNVKRIGIAYVATLIMGFSLLRCRADVAVVDGIEWQYQIVNGAAEVVGLDNPPCPAIPISTSGHISIPEKLGGCVVKHLGIQAFDGCVSLTGVSLPKTLETIGMAAFDFCSSITEITIPGSVTNLGRSAFCGCYALQSVVFEGDAPDLPYAGVFSGGPGVWNDAHSNCCVYVKHGSSGWGVDIPGMWQAVAIQWLDLTVTFDLGEHGVRIGGGELSQVVTNKCAAIAPTVATRDNGWVFSGWDTSFSHVTNDLTVAAKYSRVADNVIVHAGNLSSNELWRADKVHLVATKITIPEGVALSVETGSVVKFMPFTELAVETGGTCMAKGVTFTHVNDDSIGGDTLEDGDTAKPRVGEYVVEGDLICDDATEFRYRKLTLSVSDVRFHQRYPWNGLVDIDCKVNCSDPVTNISLYVSAKDTAANKALAVRSVWLENDATHTNALEVKSGTHRLVWDAGKDNPDFVGDAVTVEVQALGLYLVIDLSGGKDAASYPISYLSAEPQGGWTDEYKTTKLVLRRIQPGTFTMGCETTEVGYYGYEAVPHEVTISQPFYIGVFEVTQKQYELVTGNNPSNYKGDMRPVEYVSWNTIRGNSSTYNWPSSSNVDASSFMGKLRAKTGISTLDLPTEAVWEYACRAGTTTALNSGKNLTSQYQDSAMDEVGRYGYNNGYKGGSKDGKGGYSDYHTTVGSYLPNAWGLYDMHGNVYEWMLDWYQSRSAFTSAAVTDPVGPASGSYRVQRGGSWFHEAYVCRSVHRLGYNPPSGNGSSDGFRLCCSAGLR